MTIIVSSSGAATALASDIIKRAMRKLGKLSAGETPTDEEYEDGLQILNDMLDSWRLERLMVFAMRDEFVSMVSTQASYSIGPSGDLDTDRPIKIETAYILLGEISYGLKPLDFEEYAQLCNKPSTADFPSRYYYDPTMPTGTLYVYPVPNGVSELHIVTRVPTASVSLADTISLPPGWQRAMVYNLAIEMAPEFETEPSSAVIKVAIDSKANIKRSNTTKIKASTGLPALLGQGRSNIISGQPS